MSNSSHEEDEAMQRFKVKVYNLHQELAKRCLESKTYTPTNGDLENIPDYIANFSKGFPHDEKGLVNKKEYKKFLSFCHGDLSQLNALQLNAKLTSPSSMFTIDTVGAPKESFWLPPAPSIKSRTGGDELLELYAMALARDIPFADWPQSKAIRWLSKYLSRLTNFWGPRECGDVTPNTIFRGETKADLKGWFVSQFLYLKVTQGNQDFDQKIFPDVPGKDYLTSPCQVKYAQDGYVDKKTEVLSTKRYIITLRDGASYVHNDYPGQAAVAAIQILLSLGCPMTQQKKSNEDYFIDMGIIDLHDLLFRAIKLAMCGAWYQKYLQLKLRPEAFALLVDEAKRSGCNPYHLDSELLDSPILKKVYCRWGSYCLPQAFSEGSPMHPSYPSGHSTWIGAAVTIIKAFFDNDFEFDAYGPNSDGSQLVPLGYTVKVGDELDKLASNVATFRNVAGVHYRSDMLGIYLGEAIAIELLREAVQRYSFPVKFELRTRNGEKIIITKGC